jgi:hypothetical protein
MSTPIPPSVKLEGPELYAPRGARTSLAPASQAPPQTLPPVAECDPLRADEGEQRSAAAAVSLSARDAPIDDAIGTSSGLAEESAQKWKALDQALTALRFERDPVSGLPFESKPAPLDHHLAEPAPRRRRLDPELVPPPPVDMRPHIVTPMLIVLMVGCAAVIGLTMVSTFQPDARLSKRTSESIPTAAPTFDKPRSEPRLVVDVQRALANEPLSLGVSVESATGHESLMLAGLALGTRLTAGAPVSEASWQLAPRDLSEVYVYAPKDFIGIMNTAIALLSANQRLIESRAARLEWIAKSDSSPPAKQIEPETLNAPGARLVNAENAALMERGRDLLKSGDVASARLLFQRLANAGMADAALVLAATYDPRYLAQHNLIGIAGDKTKARDWYQRASELGSTEAGRILARTAAD